jgi:flagellin
MSRIQFNASALIAQTNLAKSNDALNTSLERLSTGLQINSGADNPAGLIISQRLQSEISGVTQAISNAQQATNVIDTADGALSQISNLLTSIEGLTVEAANTGAFSQQEIAANQLQIDSAVQSITRIANSTSFGGTQLLNGNLDFITSGVNTAKIQDVNVYGANFGTANTIPVTVEVLASAKTAGLFLSTYSAATTSGQLLSSVSFQVAGLSGTQSFTFASGTHLSAVADAINRASDATGVKATLASATNQTSGLVFSSTSYGSSAFVSVSKLSGDTAFKTYDKKGGTSATRDVGQDVLALVNGNLALGDGTEVSLHSTTLNVDMNLTSAAAQTTGKNGTYSFTITGGGARFQLGAEVDSNQQVGFGIQSVAASSLGDATVGYLDSIVSGGANSLLAGNAQNASAIINAAIDQISNLRGRLGAFEANTLQTNIASQQTALENLTSSESQITDTDFAAETSNMTRDQILVQAGTSVLATANSTAQDVLKLLQ